MSKKIINIAKGLVIFSIILSFNACGYKDDPIYSKNEIILT